MIDDEIEPLFYGYMISRLVNYIIALRIAHPNERILMRLPSSALKRMDGIEDHRQDSLGRSHFLPNLAKANFWWEAKPFRVVLHC